MLRIAGLTIDEIADMLDELPGIPGTRTVNIIPDSNEVVTDEDSEEEEDTGGVGMDINHLGRGILRQQGEVDFMDEDDELPDLTVYNTAREVVQMVDDETGEQDMPSEEEEEAVEENVEEAGPSRRKNRRARMWSSCLGSKTRTGDGMRSSWMSTETKFPLLCLRQPGQLSQLSVVCRMIFCASTSTLSSSTCWL